MAWLGVITVVGLIALAALTALLMKFRKQDHLEAIMAKRRADAKHTCRAEYVEGMEKIPVALALTHDTFYYENEDLQALLELARIEEVEYDDETATGHAVQHGKALRLRSHGHTFEFLLDHSNAAKLEALLTPHRLDEARAV